MREKLAILISIILAISFISPVMGGSQISDEVTADSDPPAMPLALIGKKICVDPGHGGSDTGTTGIDGPGYPDEKDHNLDMGLRLRDLLEAKGASVYMTRTTDVDVSLQGRCDIANNNNTDIFVSIHCNSVGVETVSGTETFYWGVDAVTYSVNGKRLAENVQSELVDHLGSNDRGAKADFPYFGFHLYVLDHTIMPAILTEVGFMSNQTEFDLLNQTWYRQEAAQAMFDGIMTYYRSSHAPIRINSNADFDEAHGVVNWATGDGSEGSPWIIENWDINGTGFGYCIYVGNTTEHFEVKDCVLHEASGLYSFPYYTDAGLLLYHVQNGTITHNEASSNSGHGIRFVSCNQNNIINNKILDSFQGISLGTFSENNYIVHNIIEYCGNAAISFASSHNNTISNNSITDSDMGIWLISSRTNKIINNTISNNSDYGIRLWNCDDNWVYHNKFNNVIQAEDDAINFWHKGYPSGGNYWSDYVGVDLYHGPNQDIAGSDGIGDTNYTNIQGGSSVDEYPLMSPFNYTELDVPLQEGWNLISLPTRQLNWSIDSVLESIAGKWDYIQTYNSSDSTWMSNNINRPASLNDLEEMNHLKAYWINITEPGVTLIVKGDKFNSTLSIPLYAGWNLVGYPSLVEKSIFDALAGTGYDRSVEGFDGGAPYHISQLLDTYMMKPGEGYWVHVPADTTWIVDW